MAQMNEFFAKNNLELTDEIISRINDENLDAFKCEMMKTGIKLWLPSVEGFGDVGHKVLWDELKPYLKYDFI